MALRVRPSRCVHRWYKRASCRLCVEACPTGAISLKDRSPKVDPGKCVLCGACEASCPTRAFNLGVEDEVLSTGRRGRVRVSCREKGDGVISACINALRLEHYVILASRADVVEVDARCEGCPLSRGPGLRVLGEARRLLGDRLRVEEGRGPPTPLLRRRALRSLAAKGLEALYGVRVGEGVVVEEDGGYVREPNPSRREAMKAAKSLGVKLALRHPVVDESKCTFSGVCAGVCPSGAIEYDEAGILRIDVGKCLYCGLCKEVCPEDAIKLVYDDFDGVLTYYREMAECPACGYTYPAELGECPKCATVKQMVMDFYRGRQASCGEYTASFLRRLRGQGGGGR